MCFQGIIKFGNSPLEKLACLEPLKMSDPKGIRSEFVKVFLLNRLHFKFETTAFKSRKERTLFYISEIACLHKFPVLEVRTWALVTTLSPLHQDSLRYLKSIYLTVRSVGLTVHIYCTTL